MNDNIKLEDHIAADLIVPNLKATNQAEAIRELVEHVFMRCLYYFDERNDLGDKILDRFGIEIAVDLFQYPEEECFNIFLGKRYIKWIFIK